MRVYLGETNPTLAGWLGGGKLLIANRFYLDYLREIDGAIDGCSGRSGLRL